MGKLHVLEIKPRPGCHGRATTGSNTRVYLDGKQLRGCSRVTVDISAGEVAKINLEMFATIKVKTNSKLRKTEKLNTGMKYDKGKVLLVYGLSSPFPTTAGKK